MRASLFVTAALVSCVLAAPRAQGDLTGAWDVSFNTPMGALEAALNIKQTGDELSGTISSPAGETAFKGTVKGKTLTVTFDVESPNGTISITMNGEQDADTLKGTFDFGQGSGDWTAKRKP